MGRIQLIVTLIAGSFLSLTNGDCPEGWASIPQMPQIGQESQGKDYWHLRKICI